MRDPKTGRFMPKVTPEPAEQPDTSWGGTWNEVVEHTEGIDSYDVVIHNRVRKWTYRIQVVIGWDVVIGSAFIAGAAAILWVLDVL